MATNLDGVFLCTQAAIPELKKTTGAVVNIASISGLRASTLRVAYGTSKAGVIQLTKQQAAELGEYGIRVQLRCPGPVRTKLAMAVHTQEIIDAYHDAIPLNRYGSEDEIAHAIRFLCSDPRPVMSPVRCWRPMAALKAPVSAFPRCVDPPDHTSERLNADDRPQTLGKTPCQRQAGGRRIRRLIGSA